MSGQIERPAGRARIKVAAFQAPLAASVSPASALEALEEPVRRCESMGVSVLCCPEAFLGGLADYGPDPAGHALRLATGDLARVAARLGGKGLVTILGFTELGDDGRLYNAAGVLRDGRVVGVYRKRHPAIRRSVYFPGDSAPLFHVGPLAFGVLICRDSTFAEPAGSLVGAGAGALFIPTNNGLPPGRGGPGLVDESRVCDVSLARNHAVWVIRADVAGVIRGEFAGGASRLESHGSSRILDPSGEEVAVAESGRSGLLVAELQPRRRQAES